MGAHAIKTERSMTKEKIYLYIHYREMVMDICMLTQFVIAQHWFIVISETNCYSKYD